MIPAALLGPAQPAQAADGPQEVIELRAWGVPDTSKATVDSLASLAIIDAFQKEYPYIRPVSTTGLQLPGGRTMDVIPLMQIAGEIPPEVIYVNFRQSDTYIRQKFLYPLDKYVERDLLGQELPQGHLLDNEAYLERIKAMPRYEEHLAWRVPDQCWAVMRRECPYGETCPHLAEWGAEPAQRHYHVWAFPQGPLVMALVYRRDLLFEAGLPDRAPKTLEEMLDWAKRLTDPAHDRYGMAINLAEPGWSTLGILYSYGGRVVEQDDQGQWHCVFDTEEAVEAYYFVARLFLEPFERDGKKISGVVYPAELLTVGSSVKCALSFEYLDSRFFTEKDPAQYGYGAVPLGPTGLRGSEFNSRMTGIYAGLADDPAKRDAAWQYIRFYDGLEARQIRAEVFVEHGMGRFVQPDLLKLAGYDEYVAQTPPGWAEMYQLALENGVPEPYGKNCQLVYRYVSQAVDQIRTDAVVRDAIQSGDVQTAKNRIRQILQDRVAYSNEKMLGILPPQERQVRRWVATAVAAAIAVVFFFVFRHVFQVFNRAHADASTPGADQGQGHWQLSRYGWAYLLMLPALGSIALWAYYPLARGTLMAFQDYNVRGFSEWTGMENFASVLYSGEFWHAMWVSLKYAVLYVLFGFWTPIALALLLAEVPQGKWFFRTIYFLPAVLSGVVVIFLWKNFYGEYGLINDLLNTVIGLLNHLPGVELAEVRTRWLDSPRFALFFCLLPTIWAGMGPGCLIYLAALKTVPEEIYEAADIDGAGILHKVFHVALPGIKGLILINFVGVMIGVIRSGGEFVLAMTGGGPYNPYGQTEVVGLHIFWEAFGYLRFGAATAMAWVLGAMLIGFTLMQLKKLSQMEFKAASATGK